MPARVRRSVAVVAVVLAAIGVLVGCESDRERPSATLPPLSTSSATPTPSEDGLPGPEGYPIPVEAQAYTPEAVTAFVAYYLDLLNRTRENLDSAPLRYLSRSCERCDAIATGYEEDRDAGYRRVGGAVTPNGYGDVTLFTPDTGAQTANLGVLLTQAERQTVDDAGGVVDSAPVLELIADVELVWMGEDALEWHVSLFATNPRPR